MSKKTVEYCITWARAFHSHIKQGWWPFLGLVLNQIKCSPFWLLHGLLSLTLPDLSSFSCRDEWLVWPMFFPLQNFIQCNIHSRNLGDLTFRPVLRSTVILPARFMASVFPFAEAETVAGVHVTPAVFLPGLLLLLCMKALSGYFCDSSPFSSTQWLVGLAH